MLAELLKHNVYQVSNDEISKKQLSFLQEVAEQLMGMLSTTGIETDDMYVLICCAFDNHYFMRLRTCRSYKQIY